MHTLTTLAALPTAEYGTSGLVGWLQNNAIPLVILLLAITVLWAARGGNVGKGITIVAGLFLGLAVLGIATGTNASDIGAWLAGLIRGS
ncbi:hypothetical protein ACFQU3_20345 [Terrabacter sp. GCM10028922]|jgi:hypothetical protein|uniref:hypothetical protein n=1 Tax=Terrabacter sp. GCM10028922 TaxID=3273428 RepID=UPI0036088DB1